MVLFPKRAVRHRGWTLNPFEPDSTEGFLKERMRQRWKHIIGFLLISHVSLSETFFFFTPCWKLSVTLLGSKDSLRLSWEVLTDFPKSQSLQRSRSDVPKNKNGQRDWPCEGELQKPCVQKKHLCASNEFLASRVCLKWEGKLRAACSLLENQAVQLGHLDIANTAKCYSQITWVNYSLPTWSYIVFCIFQYYN